MTPTPSLKDELKRNLQIYRGWTADNVALEDLDERADQILDLVISKVLDLPEMQNDSDPLDMKRETSRKNAFRAQLTSAIKGLKG